MSSNSNAKKGNKNLRALFSVICISIIALGLIVYFSTSTANNDPVNEQTTIEETTEPVQKSVTVEDTTEEKTEPETEKETAPVTQR